MHQVMTRPVPSMRVLARAAHAEHARQIARDGRLLGDDELHGVPAYRLSARGGGGCAAWPGCAGRETRIGYHRSMPAHG